MARQQTKKPKRKPAKPATLKPEFEAADPEDPRGRAVVIRPAPNAVRVNEYSAMTLGAVFACVRVIAESIAGLPWQEFRQQGSNRIRMENEPVDWLLDTQANPETPAFQFRETLIAHALTWGNGYAEIERDGAGRPLWLWQITPDRVEVARDDFDRIVYVVNNGGGQQPTILPAEDVYHLRGLGFDGLVGYSVIAFAARSIGVGIAADTSAGAFFENDSTPGGILTHPGRLAPETVNRLRDSWTGKHQGSANRRRVAILEEGMTWQQTGLPPEDSQLVESRQLTPAEICRWFRVPPHKIADLARATFSNIEMQSIEFVSDTLMPWIRRLETEADIKLFGRTNRGRLFTRINVNGLLRGDSASRSAYYQAMLDRGVFSPNDVLSLEDRNQIGPDGDKRFVPLNMQLLSKAGEEPPPGTEPPAAPAAEPEEEPEAEAEEPKLSHLRPIVLDVCQRIARREKGRGADAVKLDADKRGAWMDKFLDEHEGYCRAQLGAVFDSLAAMTKAPPEAAAEFLALKVGMHRDLMLVTPPEKWGESAIDPDSILIPFSKGLYGCRS